jgi:hypothetical protein
MTLELLCIFPFFFFLWGGQDWGLNLGLYTCKAGALPLATPPVHLFFLEEKSIQKYPTYEHSKHATRVILFPLSLEAHGFLFDLMFILGTLPTE